MHTGIDFGRGLTEEARRCGCNEPLLHASSTLHRDLFNLRVAWADFWGEMLASLPKWLRSRVR